MKKIVEHFIFDVWQSSEYASAKYSKFQVAYTIFAKRSILDVWQVTTTLLQNV